MKYLVIFPNDTQLERLKMLDREVEIVVKKLIKNSDGKIKYIDALFDRMEQKYGK